jgi:hypothetical protein
MPDLQPERTATEDILAGAVSVDEQGRGEPTTAFSKGRAIFSPGIGAGHAQQGHHQPRRRRRRPNERSSSTANKTQTLTCSTATMARMTHGSRSASGGEDGIPLVDVPYATRLRPGWLPQQQQQEQLGRRADGDDDAQRSRQEASTSTSSGSTSGRSSGGTRKGSLGADSVKGPLPGGVPARPPASGRAATLGADNDDESLPLPVLNSSPSSLPPMSSTAERPPLSNKRVVRVGQRIVRFLAGPSPPQRLPYIGDSLALSVTLPHFGRLSINPDAWFARTYQAQFRRRFPPGSYRHGALLFIFLAAWLIGFAFLVRVNSFRSATEPSDGSGVTFLSCIDTFAGARDSCGLDFADVRPLVAPCLVARPDVSALMAAPAVRRRRKLDLPLPGRMRLAAHLQYGPSYHSAKLAM